MKQSTIFQKQLILKYSKAEMEEKKHERESHVVKTQNQIGSGNNIKIKNMKKNEKEKISVK